MLLILSDFYYFFTLCLAIAIIANVAVFDTASDGGSNKKKISIK